MKNEVERETHKMTTIKDALLQINNINEVLEVVSRFQGSIRSVYRVKNGKKVFISGEIWFAQLSDYGECMASIIYRDKGSLFFTGRVKEIPSFKLPADKIELIKRVF